MALLYLSFLSDSSKYRLLKIFSKLNIGIHHCPHGKLLVGQNHQSEDRKITLDLLSDMSCTNINISVNKEVTYNVHFHQHKDLEVQKEYNNFLSVFHFSLILNFSL